MSTTTAFCLSSSGPLRNQTSRKLRVCTPSTLKRPRVSRISLDGDPRTSRRRWTSSVAPVVTVFASSPFAQAVALNSVLFVAARTIHQKALTDAGLRHAFALGVILWSSLSWPGYTLCFSFLIFGSLVTRIGQEKKEALGIAEKRHGARGPENLWGAAGVSALCAVGAAVTRLLLHVAATPSIQILNSTLLVGYTASLATKFADTTSSEIGKAYGTATYLVTSLKQVPRGTEGAVSLEGTAAGIFAACVTALYAAAVGLIRGPVDAIICVFAAFVATTAESYIGASIQDRLGWSNEFVNFLNTLIGAVIAMVLYLVFRTN
ncbi:hypothetical protein BWQ96_05078 [Gracilariopsis chorda]|uniref:Protein VTE6, chloroplastic n=1 Tax=Gracilariopsis chorda TaxID=448386 RepID=A0A2V3ITX1_9FLOR|nr:hypothetical protein BWQ96_05078 [Gracilariopsis chorda]|eukprot:PXF45177.1 hypothetical protein BWQ96_05078 [Gracilariopsis chorda]